MAVESLEAQDYSVFCGLCEDGSVLDTEQLERLFSIPGAVLSSQVPVEAKQRLKQFVDFRVQKIVDEVTMKNSCYFDEEMDKLDKWAEDKRCSLKISLKELDEEIKDLKKQVRQSGKSTRKTSSSKEN